MNRKDFVNLNRLGRRHHTEHFTLIFMGNGLGFSRLGITVGKRTGNAVKRNRVKRFIREFFRHRKTYFPQGYDIVIAAKKGASDLDFWEIYEELGKAIVDEKFHP